MKIRTRLTPDRECLIGLYQEAFAEPPWVEQWSYTDAAMMIDNDQLSWWVSVDETTRVTGFVAGVVLPYDELRCLFGLPESEHTSTIMTAYLAELVVDSRNRRQGIARMLTTAFLRSAQESGAGQFLVRTKPGTGNYPWYTRTLIARHTYEDGRVLFSCEGIPRSL
ncbi:MAG: GNAT family N-acetyltransferase [Candidatus Magasanikbacteria bacterium]|nr:GNAT family N-acetyltransferase [Candidatus Magasanikbacteria bacterium]NCS72198.1 GNAT family N-acetyltransferase [Candidatus Magasanikbacteria bacterium]